MIIVKPRAVAQDKVTFNLLDICRAPADVRQQLEFVYVERIADALDATLEKLVATPPPMIDPSALETGRGGDATGKPGAEPLRVREK